MMKDVWLPKGYSLIDGDYVKSLIFFGENWQIYETSGVNNILLVRPPLAQKWCEEGLLEESLLGRLMFGDTLFNTLSSNKKYALEPLSISNSPDNKVDAVAFSLALKMTREFLSEVSLHDAIYLEQYSRLLPTWTLTPKVEDEVVLGTWLAGGVVISTKSFRRLSNLVGWMSAKNLAEIIQAAGFAAPDDCDSSRTQYETRSDLAGTIAKNASDSVPFEAQVQEKGEKVFSLPGRPQLEKFFNDYVVDIIFNAEKYKALGIEFPSAIVLYGPPGCGKTFAVERLVELLDWPSYSIDSNSVGSPYIHETSKKISGIFDKAIETAPSILVIDEMEAYLSDRRSGGSATLHHVEEVAEFLRRIPEAIKNKVLVIAMTNLIDQIDPAILRRGRFDHVVEVGMPTERDVAALVESLLSKLPRTDSLNMKEVYKALTGKALSDSAFVIREAARLAAKAGKSKIDQESIDSALISLPNYQEQQNRRIGFV